MRLAERILDALADANPWQWAKWYGTFGLVLGAVGSLVIICVGAWHGRGEWLIVTGVVAVLFFVGSASFFIFLGVFVAVLIHLYARQSPQPAWAGFKCQVARDICSHMTAEERRHFRRTGAAVGALFGVIGPGAAVVVYRADVPIAKPLLLVVPAAALGLGIIWTRRYFRKVLCATEYAQQQNLTADQLRI
jgi:hypothetical protein